MFAFNAAVRDGGVVVRGWVPGNNAQLDYNPPFSGPLLTAIQNCIADSYCQQNTYVALSSGVGNTNRIPTKLFITLNILLLRYGGPLNIVYLDSTFSTKRTAPITVNAKSALDIAPIHTNVNNAAQWNIDFVQGPTNLPYSASTNAADPLPP